VRTSIGTGPSASSTSGWSPATADRRATTAVRVPSVDTGLEFPRPPRGPGPLGGRAGRSDRRPCPARTLHEPTRRLTVRSVQTGRDGHARRPGRGSRRRPESRF
jgi:hypothetical protein